MGELVQCMNIIMSPHLQLEQVNNSLHSEEFTGT